MELFWYDNINVLFEKSNLHKYIPLKSYSRNEKLNSIVRASIYLSLLFIFVSGNFNYIFITVFSLVLTWILNANSKQSLEKKNKKNVENYENIKKDKQLKKYNIRTDQYLENCHLPNNDNPFMNFMVTDKRNRQEACTTYNDEDMGGVVNDKFSLGLFKDINSIYENENSQRQFYTMPNTKSANDQRKFGEWLYGTPKTCKEGNGNQCVGNNSERLNGSSYYFY